MKQQYPALTFLTGLLLIAGVFFVHFYDKTTNTAEAVAPKEIAMNDIVSTAPVSENPGTETTATTQTKTTSTAGGNTKGTTPGSNSTGTTVTPPKNTNTSGYTNGTYSSSINYRTPESIESIGVSLTLSNGVVTNVSVDNSGSARESRRYQEAFASSVRSAVVGKSIASLQLSRVSGASLTTEAFDVAVAQIRSEAAA